LTQYQVYFRAYHALYESNPPSWIGEPWSNVSYSKDDALKRMERKFEELKAIEVSFPHIVEVKVERDDGVTVDYRKWRS
jgi:hypothetical protein